MKTIKECENLTNVKLLAEIRNRETLLKGLAGNPLILKEEISKIWTLMQRNGYKK